MDPQRWRQVEDLFHAALQESAARRREYVAAACRTDPELHREVLSLLEAHDSPKSLLETADPLIAPSRMAQPPEFAGTSRFRLLERLGAGGFGVVYSAFDRQTEQTIALKVLREVSGEAIYRFKREFRSLADIVHANLVSPIELFSHEGAWFFTMELVEGVTFVDDARTAPRLGERVRETLRQLVDGLAALHAAGKLHRDIKPANVLVTRTGQTRILDFGLAREASTHPGSATARIVGTPVYMSPEALRGHTSPASDWYSVGVLLYEALSGQPPFAGSLSEIQYAKEAVEPPALTVEAHDAPADLRTLCKALLHPDPGSRPPAAEIVELLSDAPRTATAADEHAAPASHVPFVGREREIALLLDAFAAAAHRAVLVPIGGSSGVGKTRLTRHVVGLLCERDPAVVVFTGRCFEQESIPYKAIDDLVDEVSRHLSGLSLADAESLLPDDLAPLTRLFPVLHQVPAVTAARRPVGPEPDAVELRRRGFTGLRTLLRRMAARARLVVVLDDLQWGDADSASLLRQLLAPPDPPPILFLGCYRSEDLDRSPFLKAMTPLLFDAPDVRPLDLAPFDGREARELAMSLLPEGERQRAQDIATLSGGSPIFIELIARHARSAPLAGLTMQEMLHARARELPEPARRMLDVVVVAGQPVDARAVHLAAGIDPAGGRWLAHLKHARLVRTAGPAERIAVEVYHDRIRAAMQEPMPGQAVAQLRRALAHALEQTSTGTPELLYSLYEGAGDTEPAGLYASLAAAGAARALGFDQAARFYRLALGLDPEPSSRHVLRMGLADALVHAGRGREAADVLLEAAGDVDAEESLDLRRRAADQLLRAGLIDEGLAVLDQVLRSLGWHLAKTPLRASLRFLLESAWLTVRGFRFRERSVESISPRDRFRVDTSAGVGEALSLVDNIQAAAFAARTARLALRLGEPARVARSLAVLGAFWSFRGGGRRRRAVEALEIAAALGQRLADARIDALMAFTKAAAAYGQGRFQECVDLCQISLRKHMASHSSGWERSSTEILLFSALTYVGRWSVVQDRLPGLLQDARDRGDRFLTTHALTRQTCFARLMRDDPASAERAVEEGVASWTQRGFHMQHYWTLLGRVEIALYESDGARAWRLVEAQLPQLRRSLLQRSAVLGSEVLWLYGRAGLAAAGVEGSRVLEATRVAARSLHRNRAAGALGCALSLEAGLLIHDRRVAEAAQMFERAAASFDSDGLLGYGVATRRCLGTVLGGEEGQRLTDVADDRLASEGVVEPALFTRLYHPLPGASRI